jgi:hypothetical protein
MALPVSPHPTNTKPLDEKGAFVAAWTQMFTNWFTNLRAPANSNPPPGTSVAAIPGGGSFAFDQNYLYVSVGNNQWKRIQLQAF